MEKLFNLIWAYLYLMLPDCQEMCFFVVFFRTTIQIHCIWILTTSIYSSFQHFILQYSSLPKIEWLSVALASDFWTLGLAFWSILLFSWQLAHGCSGVALSVGLLTVKFWRSRQSLHLKAFLSIFIQLGHYFYWNNFLKNAEIPR